MRDLNNMFDGMTPEHAKLKGYPEQCWYCKIPCEGCINEGVIIK